MQRFASVLIIVCAFLSSSSYSQSFPYYGPLLDPMSLTQLDQLYPERSTAYQGSPPERDPVDGFVVLASDTGAGVITHFWMTTYTPDSLTKIKLWIDGKFVLSTTYKKFFLGNQGALRGPLDSSGSAANVCDVQIPYREGFRITCDGIWDYWSNISWRPLPLSLVPESFTLAGGGDLGFLQKVASDRFRNAHDAWPQSGAGSKVEVSIPPHGESTVYSSAAPGVVQMVRIAADGIPLAVDSLSLRVYYDGSLEPNIDVPLSDFFCQLVGKFPIRAWLFKADSALGVTSFFAMPFAKSIRITVANGADAYFPIHAEVRGVSQPVDRKKVAYFHADLSRSNPTRFGVWHPVLHVKGAGRFLGMTIQLPGYPQPNFLEGDPWFRIDSTPTKSVRLTGTEDYINSGWYFGDGPFTGPFAGCVKRLNVLYRLHLLDAFDFTKGFDGDIQHGHLNDVREDYHTVAFYYLKQIPFTADRDTIRPGEQWRISGYGYQAGEVLDIKLGNAFVSTTHANDSGRFSENISVPLSWQQGEYALSVNGEESPYTIFITANPRIQIHADIEPIDLRPFDTIRVEGYGFTKGEKVYFLVDTAVAYMDPGVRVGESYGFSHTIRLPRLPTGNHKVIAVGSTSGRIIADDRLRIADEVNIEFEDILDKAELSGYREFKRCGYFWYARWSKQAYVFWSPMAIDSEIRFHFDVPYTDSFAVQIFTTKGIEYGDFEYSLDGTPYGRTIGYFRNNHGPFPDTPYSLKRNVLLTKGSHTFSFKSLGLGDSSEEANGGFDRLLLVPQNRFDYVDTSYYLDVAKQIHEVVGAESLVMRGGRLSLPKVMVQGQRYRIIDLLGRTRSEGRVSASILTPQLNSGEYILQLESGEAFRLLVLY